jgi:hypothetical protein
MASFSIGGPDTVGLSHGLGERYSSGTISLTGGTITLTDPPHQQDAASVYWNENGLASYTFGAGHVFRIGAQEVAAISTDTLNHFILSPQVNANGKWQFGSLVLSTPLVEGRKVVITGPAPYLLRIAGHLTLETGAILQIMPGVELRIQQP